MYFKFNVLKMRAITSYIVHYLNLFQISIEREIHLLSKETIRLIRYKEKYHVSIPWY